jgi:pilus assembly protein CpaD
MYKRNLLGRTVLGKVLFAAAAAAALAGCENGGAEIDDVPVPTSINQRYPIEVAKGPVKLDVKAAHGTLSEMQADTVRRFAQSAMSNRVSVVHVRRPSGGGRSISVAQDISNLLIENGVPEEAIVHSTYGGAASAPVLLSYVRAYAVTKECGAWPDNVTHTKENLPYDNFGCAQQNNLAAMVANPMDFEVPRAMTPSDPMRRGQVFTDYRTPKTPATPEDSTSQVAISTVANN